MNMQTVGGDILFTVKNRIIALQEIIRTSQHDIQCKRDQHDLMRKSARESRNTTEADFLATNPVPSDEDFASENAVIAEAQAECNALHSFTQSGPYPTYPAQYNVDLLAGTAVSYL